MKFKKIVISIVVLAAIIISLKVLLSNIYVPPILVYHSIDENEELSKLSVSPENFSRQMEFLHKHKYNVVSLEEMVNLIKNKKRIPSKTVCITLDDGYKNNYIYAYPVLEKYNFPATIFIITDFVGKEEFLTWEDMRQMQKGGITFGSHTKSHAFLPYITDEEAKEQVYDSKKILEEKLYKKISFLAYPMGMYDEHVQALVKEAGYVAACATNPGPTKHWSDIYALKRVRISRTSRNLFTFWLETSGYYTFIKEMRDD